MKRILALFLALLMLFLVSCSRAEENSTTCASVTEIDQTETSETTEVEEETNSPQDDLEEPGSTPLLYKVTDDDSVIWLMGTIHMGEEDMYPFPDYVMDAYYSADALAVEADTEEFENDMSAQYQALALFLYTDGTTIKDHIDASLYEDAKKMLTDLNSYNSALDMYEPALWWQTINALMYQNSSYESELGIDSYFLELAKDEGKEIREIESALFQMQILSDFSSELQVCLLENIVEATPEAVDMQMKIMIKIIAGGDEAEINEMISSSSVSSADKELNEEYYGAMVSERNVGMADFARDALEADEEVFICVGMGHVVGDEGMVDLLRADGYTVEIVK